MISGREAKRDGIIETHSLLLLHFSSIYFGLFGHKQHVEKHIEKRQCSAKKCSFQKESVVCGRRIGIRKGSGDIVYDPRPEDPIVQFKLPGKQAREE